MTATRYDSSVTAGLASLQDEKIRVLAPRRLLSRVQKFLQGRSWQSDWFDNLPELKQLAYEFEMTCGSSSVLFASNHNQESGIYTLSHTTEDIQAALRQCMQDANFVSGNEFYIVGNSIESNSYPIGQRKELSAETLLNAAPHQNEVMLFRSEADAFHAARYQYLDNVARQEYSLYPAVLKVSVKTNINHIKAESRAFNVSEQAGTSFTLQNKFLKYIKIPANQVIIISGTIKLCSSSLLYHRYDLQLTQSEVSVLEDREEHQSSLAVRLSKF